MTLNFIKFAISIVGNNNKQTTINSIVVDVPDEK